MSASHATLSAAADDRKARLSKYRSLKRKDRDDDAQTTEAEGTGPAPAAETETAQLPLHLSLRNYDPETRGPKLGFDAPPVGDEEATLEKQAEKIEAGVREKAEEDAKDDKGIDLFKLQPKKPNWDLKRELNKKLEILNVRTDNAIARLVRERLSAKQAAGQPDSATQDSSNEGGALEGAALVESLRVREQEEEEEERRAREAEELEME